MEGGETMTNYKSQFSSILAPQIIALIEEKRAFGYKYDSLTYFRQLDRFILEQKLKKISLPRSLVERWIKRRDHEASTTCGHRVSAILLLAEFMVRKGIPAYYPPKSAIPKSVCNYVPYIFSHEEITSLFKEADELKRERPQSWNYARFPTVFRLLYSTGLRIGEVTNLVWQDVDFDSGTIKIRQGKFHKDRFVPLSIHMLKFLKKYSEQQVYVSDGYVFPSVTGKRNNHCTFYRCFHEALKRVGIKHLPGKGPRLHDLRHTFSVHNLEKWLKSRENLQVKLPGLADYLGHTSLLGTQKYLRLTPSIFPEIVLRMEKSIGKLLRNHKNETN
jgi:integrase